MPDPIPDAAPDPAAQPDDQQQTPPDTAPDGTDWKAEARKWEQRAKDNQKAARDLEAQRKAAMTDADRAIAEAEERGRTAVRSEYGSRLAQTEFKAAVAARNPAADVDKVLRYVDLARFLGDDGEPDVKAIGIAVADLIPEGGPAAPPQFDGGARTSTAPAADMNRLIRGALGR